MRARKVTVQTEHTAERVRVTIEDDGDGFRPDILARIGEPYVTRRQKDDSAAGSASVSSSPRRC